MSLAQVAPCGRALLEQPPGGADVPVIVVKLEPRQR